jgi:hypothetical protein
MSNVQGRSESDREAFMAKLAEFRDGLTLPEQQMFDDLVRAARSNPEPAEVTPFWIGGLLGGADLRAPGTTADIWTTAEGGNNPFH